MLTFLSHWTGNKEYHSPRSDVWLDPRLEIDNGPILIETLRQKRWFENGLRELSIYMYQHSSSTTPGVYLSKLIRYSRTCGSYHDFLIKGLLVVKLKLSLRKFYGRQPLRNICVTNDYRYVPFVIITIRFFPHRVCSKSGWVIVP